MIKILELLRWSSGAYRGICCKVCGGLRGADAGRRAGDLDDVEGFPHREGCQAAELVRLRDLRLQKQREAEEILHEVRQERDRQVGQIFQLQARAGLAEEQLDEIRDALIAAVDGDVEPGETLSDTVRRLAREIGLAHAELDARGVPRTWGPNPNYRPGIPARIARFAETCIAWSRALVPKRWQTETKHRPVLIEKGRTLTCTCSCGASPPVGVDADVWVAAHVAENMKEP